MRPSGQEQPIVFISLGAGVEFWPILAPVLREYMPRFAYIEVGAGFAQEDVKTEVNRCWHSFLAGNPQLTDAVRVTYLMGTDEASNLLPHLRQEVDACFGALYPAGVMTDIFVLLDDRDLLNEGNQRVAILHRLKEEHARTETKIYIMSNLCSRNNFTPPADISHTIALLTLFKCRDPDTYVTPPDASRYNEHFFLENCDLRRGCFLTAGSTILSVPEDALAALILAEVLSIGAGTPVEAAPRRPLATPTPYEKRPTKRMEYLQGMAIPDAGKGEVLSRKQWLSRLFGQRLASFAHEEFEDTEYDYFSELRQMKINFYDLLRYLAPGGAYAATVDTLVENSKIDLQLAQDKYTAWLANPPDRSKNAREGAKRNLSPILSQELWPFIIAADYLAKDEELKVLEKNYELATKWQKAFTAYAAELNGHMPTLQAAILQLHTRASGLESAFAMFPSPMEFFRERIQAFIARDMDEFISLSQAATTHLAEGTFDGFLTVLESHIRENILPAVNVHPLDVLRATDEDSLSEHISDWLRGAKILNLRLATGYVNLYTEANLFFPADTLAANVKRHYEGRGQGRVNLFTQSDCDRVAVLYHAGAFDSDELYNNTGQEAEA
jgi:hypothetical protein